MPDDTLALTEQEKRVKHTLRLKWLTIVSLAAVGALAARPPGAEGGGRSPGAPAESDWPMYMHDVTRSGVTPRKVTLPLSLIWTHSAAQPPSPAWPRPYRMGSYWTEPAMSDYKKGTYRDSLRNMLRDHYGFDLAFHAVSGGGRVFWGSSSADTLYCVDLATGRELWRFCAEGPIRLAPSLSGDKVLFGADDGYLYCLSASTGAVKWQTRVKDDARFFAGAGRIMSTVPVRSGILVEGKRGHFCAGLFRAPDGSCYGTVDLESGRILEISPRTPLAQGYLVVDNLANFVGPPNFRVKSARQRILAQGKGQIFAQAGGLQPVGRWTSAIKKPTRLLQKTADYPYAAVGSADAVFRGGDNVVAAFRGDTSDAPSWSAKVEGRVHGLAIARGRLLVSTDRGKIYCFGSDKRPHGRGRQATKTPASVTSDAAAERYARKVLAGSPCRKGYALVLGAAMDGALALELARQSQMKVVVREPDPAKARKARTLLSQAGMCGRVSVHEGALTQLPYSDCLFNLVISRRHVRGAQETEARRVVAPLRGAALLGDELYRRPALPGAGEWSHTYADPGNTACSGDTRITMDLAVQWYGEPGPRQMVDRHRKGGVPLVVNGRLFVSGVNWCAALDAYNGTVLWEKDVPDSVRHMHYRSCGGMVATRGHLFLAGGASCLKLNAETGQEENRMTVPAAKGEWGYLAMANGMLVGTSAPKGTMRWKYLHLDKTAEVNLTGSRNPIVCAYDMFGMDPRSCVKKWSYRPAEGVIPCPAIALGAGKIFFLEGRNPAARLPVGRVALTTLLAKGADLVALDLKTGRELWRQTVDLPMTESLFVSCKGGKVVLAGLGGDMLKPTAEQRRTAAVSRKLKRDPNYKGSAFILRCHDAGTGKQVWERTYGASDGWLPPIDHPAIVGDAVYYPEKSFDLHTGKPKPETGIAGKCGTCSASSGHMFAREKAAKIKSLTDGKSASLRGHARPGCFINIIPACGMVLMPEASAGCICYQAKWTVQASFGYLPRQPAVATHRSDR